ncbi:MAG: NAD-dependent epimerase/dehydratase family protein [Acidobacteriia bacterium]|nr:NAD-dependent epimerase/dehydratase family protein [Terriglobia bacterium]
MSRVLVTGAGGFVGGHLCRRLAAAGLSIRAAARRSLPYAIPGDRFQQCLIPGVGPTTDWTMAVEGVDSVVHLAARAHVLEARGERHLEAFREVNVEGSRSLAQASIRAGVRRLVMLSSIKAMGEETVVGQCYAEDSPCRPSDPYGISKREAEQALWETAAGSNMEVVIVRAPLVYGPRVGANFLRLLRAVDRGTPLPLGSVKNRRSLCYVENLTSAIMSCLDHPAAGGQVFLVADEQAPSTRELVCRLGELLGRSPRLLPIPILLLRIAGRISGKSDEIRRLTGSLLLSTAKIRQRLDWRPPFTLDDGLRTTVAWYRSLE